MNPWNITPKQAEALDAILACDNNKAAARQLGISQAAMADRVHLARKRMGLHNLHGLVQHLIKWHDWKKHGAEPWIS